MRIEEIAISGFGPLAGKLRFPGERAVIVVAENERGKSSLMSAILFCLFDARKKDEKAFLMSFKPWNDAAFGVVMQLSAPGGRFVIERDFSSESVTVFELEDGARRDRTSEFVDRRTGLVLAERLLDLSRDQFLRTAFVRQDEITKIKDLADITRKLQEIATGRTDATAQGAIEKLSDALARYPRITLASSNYGSVDREIEALKKAAAAVADELAGLESLRRELSEDEKRLEQLASDEKELAESIERAVFLRLSADVTETRRKLADDDARRLTLEELRRRFSELECFKDFPHKEFDKLVSWRRDTEAAARQVDDAKAEAGETAAERERIAAELSELAKFDAAAEREEELREAEARLKLADENLHGAEVDLESERAQLGSDVDCEILAAVAESVNALSAQDQLFITEFQQNVAGLEREQDRLLAEYGKNEREYETLRARNRRMGKITSVVIALAVLVTGIGLLVVREPAVAKWTLVGLGGVLFLSGMGVALVTVSQRGRLEEKRESLDLETDEIQERERLVARQREKLTEVADKAGFDDATRFVALLGTLNSLKGKRYLAALEDRTRRRNALAEARKRAAELLAELGLAVPDGLSADDVRAVIDRVRHRNALVDEAEQMDRRIAGLAEVIREETARAERIEKRIQALLDRAGIDKQASLDEAVERFKEGIAKHNEYTHLKFDVIPQAVRSLMDDSGRAQAERQLSELEERFATERRKHPEFSDLQPDKTRPQYDELIEGLRAELAEKRGARTRLAVAAGDKIEKIDAQRRAGDARLAMLRSALKRAREFRDAVRAAIEEIRRIAAETYQSWARTIDNRANEMLGGFNPNYSHIRFDAELDFSLVADPARLGSDRRWNREEMDAVLSTGAKDQIYLAIRLALSEALSSDRLRLPIFLDEPFGSTDDVRFVQAMRFIGERLASRHQVVILTCHRQWHDWLRDRDPDWFNEHFELMELPCGQ